MSTKINTLELYVKGVQAYPNNMQKTELENVLGFWPADLDDSAILAERLKTRPTNCLNYDLLYDYHMHDGVADTGWYDYWNGGTDKIISDTLIYWPQFTSNELSASNEKWDLGGQNCIEYPNVIDLSKGIVDLFNPTEGVAYEWHWNWGIGGGYEYVQEHYNHTLGLNFNKCDHITLNGQTIPHRWDENLADYSNNIAPEYRWMFMGCTRLKTITGLNLSNIDMTHTNQYINPADCTYEFEGLEKYFMNCENLTTFTNVIWPTYYNQNKFTGPCYGFMFYNCRSLPDNQFPTIDFAVGGWINIWDGEKDVLTQLGINCEDIFYGCKNLTSQHITVSSLSNVNNLKGAYAYSGIQSIELPNNMPSDTRLIYMIQGCSDLTQLIIRTEGLCGDREGWWETVYGKDVVIGMDKNYLFNPSDVDLLNENLAIYVPDSELQDWKDMHATTGESDIDQRIVDMFHGLSELSE